MKLIQKLCLLSGLSILSSCLFITRQLRCDEGAPITCTEDGLTQIQCLGGELAFEPCLGDDTCTEALGCSPLCGNGSIDPGEDCDSADLGGNDCPDVLANSTGTLSCNADCTFNTTQCLAENCGNGSVDQGESCDGDDLDGQTCADIDAANPNGTLSCDANCLFDASQCAACDNDNIQEAGEACDGTDIDSCAVLTGNALPNGTATCNNCVVDTSSCSLCGDNIIQGGETCDDGCGGNQCNNADDGDGCDQFCQVE